MSVPRWRGSRLAAAALLACVLLGGCVSLPTNGEVHGTNRLQNSNGPAVEGVQVVPVPPGVQWQPTEIVGGFLAAIGASWTGSPDSLGVAMRFLTPAFAKNWHPRLPASVIDTNPALTSPPTAPRVTGGHQFMQVTMTSNHLENLVSANAAVAGSISVSSRPHPYVYHFNLVLIDDNWRIKSIDDVDDKPSDSILLLTNSDFLRDYQPRNLYFPTGVHSSTLVPYPVYIPDQAGLLGVEQLVDGLTSLPPPASNWLYRSVTTAFPRGSDLTGQVQVHGNQAVVTLTGAAARAGPQALEQIKAQLAWTLTYSPYAGTGIGSVELDYGHASSFLLKAQYASWVPQTSGGTVYYQSLDSSGRPALNIVSSASPGKTQPSAHSVVALPSGLGHGLFTAIAVSPPESVGLSATTFAGCRAKTLYVATLLPGADLQKRILPTACTSLNWGEHADLWVTGGSDVYEIHRTGVTLFPFTVALPPLTSDTFTSLQVAPDGVRVALIARDGTSSKIIVTSISRKHPALIYLGQSAQALNVGQDLADPVAVSWWDPDHLLVLDRKRGGSSQLYEVPLNGAPSEKVPTPDGAISVAANGSDIVVGIAGSPGQSKPAVKISHIFDADWREIIGASSPTFPG